MVVILAGCPSATPPVPDVADALYDTNVPDTHASDTLSDVPDAPPDADVAATDVFVPVDQGHDDFVADSGDDAVDARSDADDLTTDSAADVLSCVDMECGLDPYTGRDCGTCGTGKIWCTSVGRCEPDNSTKWRDRLIDFTVDNMEQGPLAFSSPAGFSYSAGTAAGDDAVEPAGDVCISGNADGSDIYFVMGGADTYTIDGKSFDAQLVFEMQDGLQSLGPDDELMLEWDFYDPTNLYWGTVVTIYQDQSIEAGFMFELCHYEEPTYDDSECVDIPLPSVACALTVKYRQDTGLVTAACGDAVLSVVTRTMRNGYVFRFAGYVKDDPDSGDATTFGAFLACLDTFEYKVSNLDNPIATRRQAATTHFRRPHRVVPGQSAVGPAGQP